MSRSVRKPAAVMAIVLVGAALPAQARAARPITGRWVGQDRHDYCGAAGDAVAPNGVQDIRIALAGLPRPAVASARITGHSEHEWNYGGAKNQFAAVLVRRAGSSTADLFFEPLKVETGREFCVKLTFADGAVVDVYLRGGRADPNLRMPGAAMSARWVGQGREDHTGPGPGVGADGRPDAELALARLSRRDRVASVLVETTSAPAARWAFGTNPEGHGNAELLLDDKETTSGRLFFQPDSDLANQRLKVTVFYEGGKRDTATALCGRTSPRLTMPAARLPRVATIELEARWLGQDASPGTAPGDVHVSLKGLPAGRAVAAAVLTDPARGVWAWRGADRPGSDPEPFAWPLALKRGAAAGSIDLFFAPTRDESGASLSLRLTFRDGGTAVATIAGGACDPALRAPAADRSETAARPGDDLARLAERFGTVRLTKGEYRLSKPLVLSKPVVMLGEPGAVLLFAQGAADSPWTAAIKVHAGGTTLRGFAVRFAGPVRWRDGISYGPAVIGTTDNLDGVPEGPKPGLVFEGLDIEGPPGSGSAPWEEAPRLLRLRHASAGRIANNVLRGGVVEFFEGPWRITGNEFRGTPPGTFSPAVFAGHETHDVEIRGNRARPVGPSGKTWRFVVLTNRGAFDRVEDNVIEGIGPRDDDTIPSQNAPEIILTESYHIRFEGKPSAISADRRVVKLGRLPGEPAWPGDVVAVVAGRDGGAGAWRRIVQRVEPTTYLLDAPLPAGAEIVSVTPGFVNEVFAGNSIDARGGTGAAGLVLAGNHYGCVVRDNRITGAGDAMQLMAYPSETPSIWGWSHAPFLGAVIERNTVEDSPRGATLGVLHSPATKSNKGRVYMSVILKGNTVRWSPAFLAGTPRPGAGITLGYVPSLDPGELVVTEEGDRLDAPGPSPSASALKVNAAVVNGRAVSGRAFRLPAAGADAVGAGRSGPRR